MADYTSNYNLYKPSRNDSLEVDTTLSTNFETIDTEINNRKTELDNHTVSQAAHGSGNIVHGDGTVEETLFDLNFFLCLFLVLKGNKHH